MFLANNGILIVALTMAFGMHINSDVFIALAFVLAGLSYIVNLLDHHTSARHVAFVATVAAGVVTYAAVAAKLMGVI